jgi:aurora kinase
LGKKLGKGQFGEVFIAKHKKTGFICALKIIKKSTIKE